MITRSTARAFPLAAVLALAGLATGGCATIRGQAQAGPARPADAPLAPDTALAAEGAAADRDYAAAWESQSAGDAAQAAGRVDDARAAWAVAADRFQAAADAHPEWRLALGLRAAELRQRAGDPERAAPPALRVAKDPAADARSRALAFRLAAIALQDVAAAEVKAGKLPALKVAFADERPKPPASVQPVPGTWKRFVEAVDGLLAAQSETADPAAAASAGSPTAARLAVEAARVSFAFDDVPDARRRLWAVIERWPDDEALPDAVPLYLQTFLVSGDRAAFQAAASKLGERYAAAGPAGARGAEGVKKALSDADFSDARRLIEENKPAEAAEAYEAIAARGDRADGAGALHNAAIAWDRAGKPAKAIAARERLLKDFPSARVAPTNALTLAAAQSKAGDHAAASRLYGDFLERWPDHASRCIAMQNVAAELDAAHKAEAADRYLAFGKDPACAKVDRSVTLTALRRAKALFDAAGKPARAKEAADALAAPAAPSKAATKEKTP